MTINILLLQARKQDDAARIEERQSFADAAGIPVDQVHTFDLLSSVPTVATVQQFDALMIGGSGDYYVSKQNLPNFDDVLALLRDVIAVGHPTFASCFGFQLIVQALGGEVVYAPEHTEVGTFPVKLTADGAADELFGYLPQTFQAQLGRKDRAITLPDSVLHLAGSENAPFQAFRVPGKPVWGTQFHPELTKSLNLGRFRRYMEGYAAVMDPAEIQETINGFDESPEANQLVNRFMKLLFLQ